MRHVILDTDIGTDVDDMLALVFLAKAPELCLEGVTTVHGNTLLRAKIARITCQMLGMPDLPVVPGTSETLSGHPIFWPGHEGENIPGLENVRVESGISAQQFLFERSEKYPGDLEILAIGPLTNLAQTISCFPEFQISRQEIVFDGRRVLEGLFRTQHRNGCARGQDRFRVGNPHYSDRSGCDLEGLDERDGGRANPETAQRFGIDAGRADQAMVEISGNEPE